MDGLDNVGTAVHTPSMLILATSPYPPHDKFYDRLIARIHEYCSLQMRQPSLQPLPKMRQGPPSMLRRPSFGASLEPHRHRKRSHPRCLTCSPGRI
jgi:hypothetical protein